MRVDWSSVITNVVSAVVVGIVAGAFLMVWNESMSVRSKIRQGLEEAEAELSITVDVVQETLVKHHEADVELTEQVELLIGRFETYINTHRDKPIQIESPFSPKVSYNITAQSHEPSSHPEPEERSIYADDPTSFEDVKYHFVIEQTMDRIKKAQSSKPDNNFLEQRISEQSIK